MVIDPIPQKKEEQVEVVKKSIPQKIPPKKTNAFASLDHLMKGLDPSLEILAEENQMKLTKIAIVLEDSPMQKKLLKAIQDQFLVEAKTHPSLKEIEQADFILTSTTFSNELETSKQKGYLLATYKKIETWILFEDKEYENIDCKRALWNSLKQKLM